MAKKAVAVVRVLVLFGMMTMVPIRAYSWGICADRALWIWVELCCV